MVRGFTNRGIQWPSWIWFKGCIKKHSMCAWMFLQRRLKTKEFLLQRNVPCDSHCALCDATWESDLHLMIQCPFSKSVQTSILTKLNLTPLDCENPVQLMQSVVLRLDQVKKDIQIVGKLVLNAFFLAHLVGKKWKNFQNEVKHKCFCHIGNSENCLQQDPLSWVTTTRRDCQSLEHSSK